MPPTICKGGPLYEHDSGVMKLWVKCFLQTACRYVCQVSSRHLGPTTTVLLARRRKNAVPSPGFDCCVRMCVHATGIVNKLACVCYSLRIRSLRLAVNRDAHMVSIMFTTRNIFHALGRTCYDCRSEANKRNANTFKLCCMCRFRGPRLPATVNNNISGDLCCALLLFCAAPRTQRPAAFNKRARACEGGLLASRSCVCHANT